VRKSLKNRKFPKIENLSSFFSVVEIFPISFIWKHLNLVQVNLKKTQKALVNGDYKLVPKKERDSSENFSQRERVLADGCGAVNYMGSDNICRPVCIFLQPK
jgi:hypothetical protein